MEIVKAESERRREIVKKLRINVWQMQLAKDIEICRFPVLHINGQLPPTIYSPSVLPHFHVDPRTIKRVQLIMI